MPYLAMMNAAEAEYSDKLTFLKEKGLDKRHRALWAEPPRAYSLRSCSG